MIDLEDFRSKLNLELLSETDRKELNIDVADLNRPGMQFCGFYEYFAHERPQVIGKVEMTYLESLESEERYTVLEKYMSYELPCIITCWGMTPRVKCWISPTSAIFLYFKANSRPPSSPCKPSCT